MSNFLTNEKEMSQTMDKLTTITPGVTNSLQDFCDLALENIKVYRPEITRLDGKTDVLSRELSDMGAVMRRALDLREEEHKVVCQRCSFMEERMAKLEALVAVLPTWKEDLVSKIDALGRDGRVRHEQLSMRTQMLEDQQSQHAAATRERLDTLSQLARTMAEARAQHAERMDGLEKHIRAVEATSSYSIKELEQLTTGHTRDILTNQRKLVEQGALLSMTRIDIDAIRQKAVEVEREVDKNTSNIMELQDKQELFHNNIVLMDKQLKSNEVLRESLSERVGTLERDTRVQALQATAQDYVAFKSQVADFMHNKLEEHKGLEVRLADMDMRINKGHPGLWKITEQVAAQATQLASHRDELTDAALRLASLDDALAAARKLLADQKQEAKNIQSDGKAMGDRMDNEVKRVMTYVDSRLENLCAKYEVEAIRKLIEQVRRELQEAIASMGHRVKFELLHDEVPQVNTLKAYIQQSEQAMARTMDRLGWLEAGLGKENERVEGMAAEWGTTKSALDAMILDGTFDVIRMKRELQGFKDMFEELGRMASRGQIITVSQAEVLVDKAVRGPAVDAIVAKKLMDSKILKQELSGYVPRHELEGLRNLIHSNATLTLMASNAAASAQPTRSDTPPPDIDHDPHPASNHASHNRSRSARNPGGAPSVSSSISVSLDRRSVTPTLPAPMPSLTGPAAPPPAAKLTVEDSALLAVYKRLAEVDEQLAVSNALGASLQERVDHAAQQAATTALQVDAEVPSLKAQLSDLQEGLSKVRSGHTESAHAEAAVRRLVNKTVLPEVIERQACDTRRMVKYMTRHMSRTADIDQLKDLQLTVAALRQQVEALAQPAAPAAPVAAAAAAAGSPAGLASENSAADSVAGLQVEGGGGAASVAGVSRQGSVAGVAGAAGVAGVVSRQASVAGAAGAAGVVSRQASVAGAGGRAAASDGAVLQGEGSEQQAAGAGSQAPPSKEASSSLEDLMTPDPEQQAVAVRALAVRVEAMEKLVTDLQSALSHAGSAAAEPAVGAGGVVKVVGAGVKFAGVGDQGEEEDGLHADLLGQLSELQVAVLELTGQLPLMARSYEVEGLRRALSDMQLMARAKSGHPSPQLNITLACPTATGQHPPHAAASGSAIAANPSLTLANPSLTLGDAIVAPVSRQASRASSLRSQAPTTSRSGSPTPQPEAATEPQQPATPASTAAAAAGDAEQPPAAPASVAAESSVASQGGNPPETAQKQQHRPPSRRASVTFAKAQQDGDGLTGQAAEDDLSRQRAHEEQLQAVADCYTLLQQHCAWQQVVAGQLAEQMAALQVTAMTADERGTAVEQRWLSSSAKWQQGMSLVQEALPRMERLASTTEKRVHHILTHTSQFVVQGQLDELMGGCATVQQIRKQLTDMQASIANIRITGATDSSPASPSAKVIKNKQTAKARSNLAVTDLASMPLPLPQLLPSFTSAAPSPRPETDDCNSQTATPRNTSSPDPVDTSPPRRSPSPLQHESSLKAVRRAESPQQPEPTLPFRGSPRQSMGGVMQQSLDAGGFADFARQSQSMLGGGRVGSMAPARPHPGVPGWGADGTPRHLHGAEHADTELAGIMHDLMHANHRELVALKDGPLPGSAALDQGQGSTVREAALKRLRTKPYEVQQHVELLESAKKHFDRLVGTTAVSTTDYVALYCLMLDVRVKLMEDHVEVQKEQMSTAYRNLESAFTYLKKLQEAVNSKGSVTALAAVDRCLRSLGKEMVGLGHPPSGVGQPGLLYGTQLGSADFWSPFLSLGGADMSSGRMASPPRSPAQKRPATSQSAGGARPLTPSTPTQVIPQVTGTAFTMSGLAYPPQSFMKDKRDIVVEQQRVMATLKLAEAAISQGSLPTVQYVGGNPPGSTGLPVLARKRPATAKPDVRA